MQMKKYSENQLHNAILMHSVPTLLLNDLTFRRIYFSHLPVLLSSHPPILHRSPPEADKSNHPLMPALPQRLDKRLIEIAFVVHQYIEHRRVIINFTFGV